MTMIGCLDSLVDGVCSGWAFDVESGASAEVTIAIDGHEVGRTVGVEFRSDVSAAGYGDGRCGFVFSLPVRAGIVQVAFARTGAPLIYGERLVIGDAIPLGDLFAGVLARGMWMPKAIGVDDRITITGWAVPPFGMPMDFAIAHDGVALEMVSRTPSADAARCFGLGPGSGAQNFVCIGALDPSATPTTKHTFTFLDARTGMPFNPHHAIVFQSDHDGPIPNSARRKRVGGDVDLGPFLLQGSTAYARLDQVLHEYFATSFADVERILDWGCGCGRIFSHLPPALLPKLTGIDIDADNVSWCREAYPMAHFATVPLEPPTGLPDAAFDVAFGISVFTHLLEPAAEAWLRELHRVTKPGGAVLATILGEIAWAGAGLPLETYGRFRSTGFYVSGKNPDLDDAHVDASAYYNTFISRRYVYERWSRYFEVLDVIAGGIGNHQDLVVLRRRP